ncbi:MAG: hypothetical protein WBV61_04280 [Rhodanobacteraceae bacterium]
MKRPVGRARPVFLVVCMSWFIGLAWAGAAQAGFNEYAGTTIGGPTFDRLYQDCVSTGTTGVNYQLQPFTVSADGDYAIHSEQSYDGYLFVYGGGFDPDSPMLNCLFGDDDGDGGIGTSDLTATLSAGTEYLLITTGFNPADSGTFTNQIDGPGDIVFGARYQRTLSASDPVYDRPQADCVSQQHPNVAYKLQPFVVDADGIYGFTSAQNFDGFLALYTGSFNRSHPLADCTVGNDDGFNGIGTSSFSATLSAGVQYVLVTAGYSAADLGTYTNTIAGPGHVAPGGVTYTGSIVDEPTFNRPNVDCGLNSFATSVGWSARQYVGNVSGTYTFSSAQNYDGFLSLYHASFDSGSPTTNCLTGNDDDYPGIGTSRFSYNDSDYFSPNVLVTTAFSNGEEGTFVNEIQGPDSSRVALTDQEFAYSGTTSGAPTFTRPFYSNCSQLSGTTAPYQATSFSVSISANYEFLGVQGTGYDGYMFLYEAPFSPADGITNCLDGSDDGPEGIGTSAFIAAPLRAFQEYVLVTTGYGNTDSGNFINSISGPGSIALGNDRIFGNGFEP